MATTNVTMRMDVGLKNQLQELVSNLGMDMTTFFVMTAKQAVREQALPFRPAMNEPNQETIEAMAEVEYMRQHPDTGKVYSSFSELLNDLDDEEDDGCIK
ncbi:MAG: type II toxin-antitoxin system RelB/DinJ family antitoxin [Lachnospiraceae bacterium]|nr:type II toxin-antitoxin system RelB/DinJ family antitoxin [Lachnospiraceae bacterium]